MRSDEIENIEHEYKESITKGWPDHRVPGKKYTRSGVSTPEGKKSPGWGSLEVEREFC